MTKIIEGAKEAPQPADIVERLNVVAGETQKHPFEMPVLIHRAATEIATLRQQLEESRERNLIANERADNALADVDRLKEACWQALGALKALGAEKGWAADAIRRALAAGREG